MSSTLFILIYCILAYGICNVIIYGHGPWEILDDVRDLAQRKSPRFWGPMTSCMMCLPTNLGFVLSLISILIGVAFTPFTIWFGAYTGFWWALLKIAFDGFFTSGAVWLIHHVETWFENNALVEEENE